jgi:hypothetical protein
MGAATHGSLRVLPCHCAAADDYSADAYSADAYSAELELRMLRCRMFALPNDIGVTPGCRKMYLPKAMIATSPKNIQH